MRLAISNAVTAALLAFSSCANAQAAAAAAAAAAAQSSSAGQAASGATIPTGSQSTGNFPSLTGTWTSKSKQVLTGPGFYDPVNEKFLEPSLTGISYSFTDDGWYEEAYYRAISNPTTPSCPRGILQWQHGQYTVNGTGSILLTPIEVDGRQQTSDPCAYKFSEYTRYKQKETFQRYELSIDKFHNVEKLVLYQFNGAPMMPLYLAYNPPQMLPTMTLNPTASATGTGTAAATAAATATSASKARMSKRENIEKRVLGKKLLTVTEGMNAAWFWYAGLGFIGIGAFMYGYSSD